MKRYRCKGTITVFLSLISVLFLSLICTAIESARIQETRGKAAAALDMGIFSLFGEYENRVLEKYDLFFLDGAAGTGSYSLETLEEKLTSYMTYNVSPNKGVLLKGYDPFPLTLKKAEITGVALATDENGAPFYQQAVSFMKENLATEAISIWRERQKDAQKLEDAAKEYQNKESSNGKELKDLQKQQQEEKKALQEAAQEAGSEISSQTEIKEYPAVKNPLETIRKIRRRGLLGLVLGDQADQISEKSLPSNVPSRRSCKKGNLKIKKTQSGVTANLLFQEYLFGRFPSYSEKTQDQTALDYGLEYILCGKNTDQKNLKAVITRLLLLREGANFVYLTGNAARKAEADALSLAIVGAVPVPGLQVATTYALLLVWAYAESLLDLRILFQGGKVPVLKDDASWRLSLENIPNILEWLDGSSSSQTSGLDYEGYLQVLFTMGKKAAYPMRALDLLESDVRKNTSNTGFRADYAVVKASAKASYTIKPVFLRVSAAFLGTGTAGIDYAASGAFAY